MPRDKPKVVTIVGPTASGKSELSFSLAREFNGEIISADSLQVYRYMDIGTAKPSPELRREIPHHLIDIRFPDQRFNASDFRTLAAQILEDCWRRQKICFVVGGTGLYVKALLWGLFPGPDADHDLRSRLRQQAETLGREHLHRSLTEVDPETASRLHPRDLFRVIRALEVFHVTGRPISWYHSNHAFLERPYEVFKIGLSVPRHTLYQRIDQRVESMVDGGIVEEVEALLERGYGAELKPMKSIGYRHICDFLSGKRPLSESIDLMKGDTRRYGKRQITWFQQDDEIHWFEWKEKRKVLEKVRQFMKNLR